MHEIASQGVDARSVGQRSSAWLLSLLLLAFLLRWIAMANVVLIPEEAYYWMYSENPELSYFDHPPMVAWVIGLGTWLWGNTEFGVRFVNHLLIVAAAGLLYGFGRMWFGHRASVWAVILFLTAPIYFSIALIATMDAALVFFWMVCLCGVTLALQRGRWWGWYVAGVGLGVARGGDEERAADQQRHRPRPHVLGVPNDLMASNLRSARGDPVTDIPRSGPTCAQKVGPGGDSDLDDDNAAGSAAR